MGFRLEVRAVAATVLGVALVGCGGGSGSGAAAEGGAGGSGGSNAVDPGGSGGAGDGGSGGTAGGGGTGGFDAEATCRGTVFLPDLPLLPTDAPVGEVALADFEGDGDLDLFVGLRGDPPSIGWLENRDGRLDTVAAGLVFGTVTPARLLAVDLDGAGPLDLVASGTGVGEGVTAVLRGDASQATVDLPWVNAVVGDLAAGDFDGDGDADLAVVGDDRGAGEVRFVENRGGGALAWTEPAAALDAPGPHRLAAGDLDGDGADDLLVLGVGERAVRRVVLASGTPAVAPAYDSETPLQALAMGDLDGDGSPDLAFDHGQAAFGDGNGRFSAGPPPAFALASTEVLLADVDADGDLDAVGTDASGLVEVLVNESGAFASVHAFLAGSGAPAAVAGDFTGDGVADLAIGRVGANEVELHANPGDGRFAGRVPVGGEAGGVEARAAVFDLEGARYVAVTAGAAVNVWDGAVRVAEAGSPALAVARTVEAPGAELTDLAAGDVDGDGRVDLVALDPKGDRFLVFAGLGGLDFAAPVAHAAGNAQHLALGDIDGNHALDVVVGQAEGLPSLRVYRGPAFTEVSSIPLVAPPNGILVHDFDDDGRGDALVWTRRTIEVLHGKANGSVSNGQAVDLPARAVAVTDADLDGTADLLIAPLEGESVQVYAGIAGTCRFEQKLVLPVGGRPGPIAIGDIDGDRADDAFVLLPEQGAIRVLRGAVGYLLSVAERYPAGTRGDALFGASLVAPDLSGDGSADLVLVGPDGAWTFAAECRE
jgi:hypothetical protein